MILYDYLSTLDTLLDNYVYYLGLSFFGLTAAASIILAPIFFLLTFIFRRNGLPHTVFWNLTSLCSFISLASGIIFLAEMQTRPNHSGPLQNEAFYILFATGLLMLLVRVRKSAATPEIKSKARKSALIIAIFLYGAAYFANDAYYAQHVVLQVVDINGKPLENANITHPIFHEYSNRLISGTTDKNGRMKFSVDRRNDKKFNVGQAGYKTMPVSIWGSSWSTRFINLVYDNPVIQMGVDKVSVEYDEDYTRWPSNKIYEHTMPKAGYLLITVILPPANSTEKPDYSKAKFGPLLSDPDAPDLQVAEIKHL